jgi:hypothetical protein
LRADSSDAADFADVFFADVSFGDIFFSGAACGFVFLVSGVFAMSGISLAPMGQAAFYQAAFVS